MVCGRGCSLTSFVATAGTEGPSTTTSSSLHVRGAPGREAPSTLYSHQVTGGTPAFPQFIAERRRGGRWRGAEPALSLLFWLPSLSLSPKAGVAFDRGGVGPVCHPERTYPHQPKLERSTTGCFDRNNRGAGSQVSSRHAPPRTRSEKKEVLKKIRICAAGVCYLIFRASLPLSLPPSLSLLVLSLSCHPHQIALTAVVRGKYVRSSSFGHPGATQQSQCTASTGKLLLLLVLLYVFPRR